MTRRKPYVRSMDRWWMRNGHFKRYMLREATSVFLALYALVLLVGVIALRRGEVYYQGWLDALAHPLSIACHLLFFAAACYHTVTWFAVSPKAMPPVRLGKTPLRPAQIIGGQYVVFAIASVLVVLAVATGTL